MTFGMADAASRHYAYSTSTVRGPLHNREGARWGDRGQLCRTHRPTPFIASNPMGFAPFMKSMSCVRSEEADSFLSWPAAGRFGRVPATKGALASKKLVKIYRHVAGLETKVYALHAETHRHQADVAQLTAENQCLKTALQGAAELREVADLADIVLESLGSEVEEQKADIQRLTVQHNAERAVVASMNWAIEGEIKELQQTEGAQKEAEKEEVAIFAKKIAFNSEATYKEERKKNRLHRLYIKDLKTKWATGWVWVSDEKVTLETGGTYGC
ncbi:hypothetical protein DFH07DRAFT_775972 [Mycena maculata]|uniref:Uncharacterized protein n=1 Tax=Mycena maculata TaxID=230809 RepID=A0AAD7IS21_9AGAR|nr:hypothetical protein DFH07DRAFT_775972 [Mycena maculata]